MYVGCPVSEFMIRSAISCVGQIHTTTLLYCPDGNSSLFTTHQDGPMVPSWMYCTVLSLDDSTLVSIVLLLYVIDLPPHPLVGCLSVSHSYHIPFSCKIFCSDVRLLTTSAITCPLSLCPHGCIDRTFCLR